MPRNYSLNELRFMFVHDVTHHTGNIAPSLLSASFSAKGAERSALAPLAERARQFHEFNKRVYSDYCDKKISADVLSQYSNWLEEFLSGFREARAKLHSLPSAKTALEALDFAEGDARRAHRICGFYNRVLQKKPFQAKTSIAPVQSLISEILSTQYVNRNGHKVELKLRGKTDAGTKLRVNRELFLDGFGVIASDAGGSPSSSGRVSVQLSLSRMKNAVIISLVRRNRTLEQREQDRPLLGKLGAQAILASAGVSVNTKELKGNRTRYEFSLPLAA